MEKLTLDMLAEECIIKVAELIKQENRNEAGERQLFEEYRRLGNTIKAELGTDTILLQYISLVEMEAAFFDPREAYLAGRKAKLDGDSKQEAYDRYVHQIKEQSRYLETKSALNAVFLRIMNQLRTERLREDWYRFDRLQDVFIAPIKRKLYVFFYLGFDCCMIEAEEMGLTKKA